MKKIVKQIFSILDKKDKKYLIFLLFLSIIISIVETVGIGVILPFIKIASNFEYIFEYSLLKDIYLLFDFHNPENFVIFIGVILIIFYVFRSIINLIYYFFLAKFSQGRYYVFANKLFKKYLNLPYKTFLRKNVSLMSKTIIIEAQNLSLFLSNLLFMVSEIIIAFFIYMFLLYVSLKITIIMTIFLGLNIFLIFKVISRKVKEAGIKRDKYQSNFYKMLNDILNDFKLFKMRKNKEEIYVKFQNFINQYAKVNILHSMFSQIPRLYLEAVSFSLIALIVIIIIFFTHNNISASLNLITMFLLALFRLMPSINRILSSYNNMLFYSKAVNLVFNDLSLKEENLGKEKVDFKNKININNLSFSINGKKILKNITLEIKKGEKVAFIGESGSGKTTLIDNIIGIYIPSDKNILVDNVSLKKENLLDWRSKIGYIPQHVYLFDGNIAENVSLEENYDESKVIEALKRAKIYDFLLKHDGIYTKIGEKGITLSGGQKQRIAIARALYNEPEILVLDEATSALDEKTEKEIMEEIYDIAQNKTLIIVTHKLSTIKKCDTVYTLSEGKIVDIARN